VGLTGADAEAAARDWSLLGGFYGQCMDEAAVETAGMAPLEPVLTAIAKADKKDLGATLGMLQAQGLDGLWSVGVFGDLKDPDTNMAYLEQAGLGLPDRDYYLKDDEGSVALQVAYRAYIAQLLEMSGIDAAQAKKDADDIYAFEKALAQLSLPRDELRDPEKVYNPITIAELDK
ncbi:MAG: M13 family peptidase, partial [Myxococcales bacterium]|nr:M13 family peptidase [Myxococcales bacterium]